MNVDAFVSTGGALLIALAVGVYFLVFWWLGKKAPLDTDLWEGGVDRYDRYTDEKRARTTLYVSPPADRHVENVVPVERRDRW